MKYKLLTIHFLILTSVFSQELKIKVQDLETQEPIAYAHIFDGSNGTITNSDGEFVIDKKKSKKITISHIGYEPKEILVSDIEVEQPINLNPKSIVLDEVEIYSIDYIFHNITKGLKTNYNDGALDELLFFRVSLMKNDNEGQLSEGYLQVLRDKYFDRSKNRKLDIHLISYKKLNNLKNIDFQYFSFEKLLQLSETFINLKNGYYNFHFIKIDDVFMKIVFSPKEEIEPSEIIYDGHIVIDSKSYAIIEFQFSIAEIYKKYLTQKNIGSNLFKRDVNASKLVKWHKDVKGNKYRLSFFRIRSELILENSKSNTKDKYTATYELYNVGNTEDLKLTDVKKKKTRSKKNVFEYSNLNSSHEISRSIKSVLRNKEQDSISTLLNKHE